jgi:phosphotransferase system  glucose/maltose/N-acetylglucosamine-specific IIC component
MKSPISWVIALAAGSLVLAGYFLRKMIPVLGKVQALVMQWAVVLAALALLVGVGNLLAVHWRKVKAGKSSSFYSVVLIVSMVATIGITAWDGPTGSWSLWIMNNIQIPIEASLVALLAIVLAYTAARMFRYRINLMTVLFIVVVIVILLGTAPLYGTAEIPALGNISSKLKVVVDWLNHTWTTAGARGILLGVALGTIAAGLRILLGADRPYGG